MPATVHRLAPAAARSDGRNLPEAAPAPRGRRGDFDLLTLFILLVGLAPFVELALTRDGSPLALGLGAVMVIFAAREIMAYLRRPPAARA